MNIFLHFLNREIYRAVGSSVPLEFIPDWLLLLIIGTSDRLFSNYSNLFEGEYLTSNRGAFFNALIGAEILEIAGERVSAPEFLGSRELMYEFDRIRYPMYFDATDHLLPNNPAVVMTLAMTSALEQELNAVERRKRNLSDYLSSEHDIEAINKSMPSIRSVLKTRETRAITRSLFSGKIGRFEAEEAVSRLISSIYVQRYMQELGADIAVGIQPLIAFEGLSLEPHRRNIQVLNFILRQIGVDIRNLNSRASLDAVLLSRHSIAHQEFARRVREFCDVLNEMAIYSGDEEISGSIFHKARRAMAVTEESAAVGMSSNDMFLNLVAKLSEQVGSIRKSVRPFEVAYETVMDKNSDLRTVLVVTATDSETDGLFLALRSMQVEELSSVPIRLQRTHATEVGKLGNARLIHVQCEPGSVGPSSSQSVIGDAIRELHPSCIVMGGIAFGANSEKQEIGDLLVSKMIVEYEKEKVQESNCIRRGQRVEASPKLLSLFRAARADQLKENVHFGVMLSGEKLVNSKRFRKKLLRLEPEAIGGEMEGAGLVAAANRAQVDWIVVKGIVDWAFNKEERSDPKFQTQIAEQVFLFIFRAIRDRGVD